MQFIVTIVIPESHKDESGTLWHSASVMPTLEIGAPCRADATERVSTLLRHLPEGSTFDLTAV